MSDNLPPSASFDADEFMRGFAWSKWSDCREMVQAAFDAGVDSGHAYAAQTVAAERAEVEALRKDAARYRWLRACGGKSWTVLETNTLATGQLYDAAIDAAMGKP